MPIYVDHEARRRQIVAAAIQAVAEDGPKGLSFRAVAERMGGSTTVVSHYFPSRQALVEGIASSVTWLPDELDRLQAGISDPVERLRIVLDWLLPSSPQGLQAERARLSLSGERDAGMTTQQFFDVWDRRVREILAERITGLVPDDRVAPTVDLLRCLANGITLSTVEHTTEWTPQRQRAVMDDLLRLLGILSPVSATSDARTNGSLAADAS